jgi:hypothetical protein
MEKKIKKIELSEEKIIQAIGKSNKYLESSKVKFASALKIELDKLFAIHAMAFPHKDVVAPFANKIRKLERITIELKDLIDKYPFIKAICDVSSRAVATKGYKVFDFDDFLAFSQTVLNSIQHPRFFNSNSGPDSRLPLEAAYIIAKKYHDAFKKMPGITGLDKRDGETVKVTPYQRVCDLIAETKNIKIGRYNQEKAISCLKLGEAPFPFFKPDVQNLPTKKIN